MTKIKEILPQQDSLVSKNIDESTRFIRVKQVAKYLDCSISTIWSLRKNDVNFPKPIKVSDGITLWDKKELDTYILSKKRL